MDLVTALRFDDDLEGDFVALFCLTVALPRFLVDDERFTVVLLPERAEGDFLALVCRVAFLLFRLLPESERLTVVPERLL